MTSTVPNRSAAGTEPGRRLVLPGLAAAVAAAVATTAVAALGKAAGVDFEVPDGTEQPIPLLGVTNLAFVFSVVGVAIAAGLRRWNKQPAKTFLRVALVLTAVSLIPPFVTGANLGTSIGLVLAHLTAAAIMIPTLVSRLAD